MPVISRRPVLLGLSVVLAPRRLHAASAVARVTEVTGEAVVHLPGEGRVRLSPGMELPERVPVILYRNATAGFVLDDGTLVNAGQFTQLFLLSTMATRASVNISGVAVVDRRGATVGTSIVVSGPSFDVKLAEARVFMASLREGRVFVKDGTAEVRLAQNTISLSAGEGVSGISHRDQVAAAALPPPGTAEPAPSPVPAAPVEPDPPPEVSRWSDETIADAFASVGLTV